MKHILILALFLTGCATNKQFTDGNYNDEKQVRLLDDKFNEADIQKFSSSMIDKLSHCPQVESNKTVVWGGVKNQTSEHIDLAMITNVITSELTNQSKLSFINKTERETLESEYKYEQSGRVRSPAAISQISANYLLTGSLHSNIQEVGKDKLVYYQMTVNLTDTRTNRILCAYTDALRKDFKKKTIRD